MKFRTCWYLWTTIFSFIALLMVSVPTLWGTATKPVANTPTVVVKIPTVATNTASDAFITRSGTSLWMDGRSFRFSGANISWLGLLETNRGVVYPSHFMVDDALATASLMGATVVRSHTLGISTGCKLCVEATLGTFNQEALQHIDYAIVSARKQHIRLIIPLTDNWHYYLGGKHTFTDWRGITDEQAFYYNYQVISDFKQYINVLFNHVNIYTGIAYKDDPTILAWETGNELTAPADWVQTIASYIKSIDYHHLLMDGNSEHADQLSNFLPDLHIDAIDLYSGHYYPPTVAILKEEIYQANGANKVFIVGEYDWNTNNGDSLSDFLLSIEQNGAAGDMYWSLFPHDDAYGFVKEEEHYTLHYPGDTPDMRRRIALLYTHAYTMQGLPVPSTLIPGTPYITSVQGNTIAWRGAFGADTYTVERLTEGVAGSWTVICDRCATDNSTPWVDTMQPTGAVWYRVRAYSVSGVPGPYSNIS